MPTLLDSPARYTTDAGARTLLERHRAWIYGILLLLTLAVIVADRRAAPSRPSADRHASTIGHAPAGTQDDRPLLLPDR